MNAQEAMQALLDGKRIHHAKYGNFRDYIWLSAGCLVWNTGEPADLRGDQTYELYEEPNTHVKGTFAWAREEANRGRKTIRHGQKDLWGEPLVSRFICLSLADIDAADWEVVP